ncbi:hypothetical protein HMPREF0970_00782 [Schaalia odontolytica F0309]|uniref:Uncharacterized protein n=1 Tax=Schaalia odontolytica F0309 TaxID=649742 RepID=D4TXW2_9ACTO|nr:hypothetical protein HMPREF0970_00782 [Schaalia odontolytica F0309]
MPRGEAAYTEAIAGATTPIMPTTRKRLTNGRIFVFMSDNPSLDLIVTFTLTRYPTGCQDAFMTHS